MPSVPLPNFSKGEIGPELYGRIDTSQYSAGLKTCRNFLVQRYGGVTFRPGTRLVGFVELPELGVRLVPFQSSQTQSYVLAMGQGQANLAARGGFVVEQNTKITAIALGYPTVLTIPFHGYDVGNRLFFDGVEGTTEINGRILTVNAVPDADTIEINVDSSDWTPFTSSTGTENVGPPPPPPAPPAVPPVVDPPESPPVSVDDPDLEYDWRYGNWPPWFIPPEF